MKNIFHYLFIYNSPLDFNLGVIEQDCPKYVSVVTTIYSTLVSLSVRIYVSHIPSYPICVSLNKISVFALTVVLHDPRTNPHTRNPDAHKILFKFLFILISFYFIRSISSSEISLYSTSYPRYFRKSIQSS